VSRHQKGKTNLDFTGARDSEQQWYQLGHIQICTSLQTDNYASTSPSFKFFTGRMPFLPPNQQRQSTEGIANVNKVQVTTYNNTVIMMCINAICHSQAVTTDLKCKSFFQTLQITKLWFQLMKRYYLLTYLMTEPNISCVNALSNNI